jgi:hypothetical protein
LVCEYVTNIITHCVGEVLARKFNNIHEISVLSKLYPRVKIIIVIIIIIIIIIMSSNDYTYQLFCM